MVCLIFMHLTEVSKPQFYLQHMPSRNRRNFELKTHARTGICYPRGARDVARSTAVLLEGHHAVTAVRSTPAASGSSAACGSPNFRISVCSARWIQRVAGCRLMRGTAHWVLGFSRIVGFCFLLKTRITRTCTANRP